MKSEVASKMDAIFFSSCRARSRLGRSSKRLVVDQLFSRCKKTGEKQKARCLPKLKQTTPKHKHNPNKQNNRERHPEIKVKHYAFRKIQSTERSVPLHDDIAIPSSIKCPRLLQVGESGGPASSQLLNKGDKLVHPRPSR